MLSKAKRAELQLQVEGHLDEFVLAVRERLKKGALRWGHHRLGVRAYPVDGELDQDPEAVADAVLEGKPVPRGGFYILDVTCTCCDNGVHFVTMLFRSYSKFWDAFSAFCMYHYSQLKNLV
nr:hypothetical protein [Candidatus Sigynarchaeota archaeon]